MELTVNIRNLEKEFPGITALKNVSLKVKKGDVHGLLGPNGAGKTTTMNIIAGLIAKTKGSISLFGKELENQRKWPRRKIGHLPENPPLYSDMTVKDYLTFVSQINGVKKNVSNRVKETMERTGLSKVKNRLIGNLSKGMKQRVGIAQALVFDSELLIFDEPTIGLDPISIMEIRKLIKELSEEHTIILSTHHLKEVELICGNITLINNGITILSGEVETIKNRFRTRQILSAKTRSWDVKKEKQFYDLKFIEKIEVSKEQSGPFDLTFYLNDSEDKRDGLTKKLVESNCGLLGFGRKNVNLEDLFINLTKESL